MLTGSALIFAFVIGLIAAAFMRSGEGGGSKGLWIIGLGLVFPMAVLAMLLAYGLIVGERLLPRTGDAVISVRAEARMWSWSFSYDDAPGLVTQDILHIPAGRPVDVSITTADVIHSFWAPRLAGKLDAIPGHVNVLRIEADAPGSYEGRSAEFSGDGYVGHRFVVIAHEPAEWEQFLAKGNQ